MKLDGSSNFQPTSLSGSQALLKWATLKPEAVALDCNGIRYSYQALASQVARLLKSLKGDGLGKGRLIAYQFVDWHENLIFQLAVEATGGVPIQITSVKSLTSDLIAHLDAIYTDEVVPFVCTARLFPACDWMAKSQALALTQDDYEWLGKCAAADDPVYFGSTSATTGLPKYFFETKEVMNSGIAHMQAQYFPDGVNDFICVYALKIYAAYAGIICALNKGGTIHSTPLDGIAKLPQSMASHHLALVLRDARALLDSLSDISKATSNMASVRILGDFLPADIRQGLEEKLCKRVINTYSSNEAGQIAEVLAEGYGKIFDQVRVRILNNDYQVVPATVQGRIAIKSPMAVSCYLWNDRLNAAHFRDGWFISNDLGYLTEDHKLYCVGRFDDMLVIGGIKIPPYPIERRLRQIAGIHDAVLVADANKLGTDKVLVCIEYTQPLEINTLNNSVCKCLYRDLQNPIVYYQASFPRTETGKIIRASLVEKYLRHKANAKKAEN